MRKIFFVVAFALMTTVSWGQVETDVPYIGTASSLLGEAQAGRRELLDALLKLKDNVRELRDQKTFDEFFVLLDQFETLADQENLHMIYPNAVGEVGKTMIMHGSRWLKVAHDSEEKILSYMRWADLTAALQFQRQVIEEIDKIKNPELFKKAFSNLQALEAWAAENFADDLYLLPIYQKTISEISFNALTTIDIRDEQEWSFWISGVNNQDSAQDYVAYLNEKILAEQLKAEDAAHWFSLVNALGEQLQDIQRLSSSVRHNFGVLFADLTAKAIASEYTIDPTVFNKTVSLLDASSVRSLAFRWTNPEKAPTDQYATTLVPLSKSIYNRSKDLKLGQTALEIERFISGSLSAAFVSQNGIEGTYKLTGNGRTWKFTILRDSEQRLIAALCDDKGVVCFTFFNVQYNVQDNKFYASERVPDDDFYNNIPAIIEFGDNDSISIELPYAYRVGTHISGHKVESYENYMANPFMDANLMSGTYTGQLKLKSGSREMILILNTLGEHTVGRMESSDGHLVFNFGRGNDGNIGYLYLTTGQNSRRSWTHLRLKQINDDEITGVLISGGKGVLSEVKFTRK